MNDPFILGWEEWVMVDQLGLPAIKAKIDTGAKTSALHAFDIEPFGPAQRPKVRFAIHPIPDDRSVEVHCSAALKDRREITSSNGETELRFVIETPIRLGGREWPIEITLTNRDTMAYRMLLGRSAIAGDMVVNPTEACLQGERSYEVYAKLSKPDEPARSLRIAILTKEPKNASNQRLVAAGEKLGHELELINTSRCYLGIDALRPSIHYDGAELPRYDAVIPRIGAGITRYGMAVVRQFELSGVFVLNAASAIGAARDKLYAHQLLAAKGIAMPMTAFANSPKDTRDLVSLAGGAPVVLKLLQSSQGRGVVLAETRKTAEALVDAFRGLDADFLVQDFVKEAAGEDIRAFVVGGKVVAGMRRTAAAGDFRSNLHAGGMGEAVKITAQERAVALKAVRAMGLNVAGVDMLRSDHGPKVLEVNASPGLEGFENAPGKDLAAAILRYIETKVRALVKRAR
ncbi:MAG: 30S ribosomal protein S6--L-glutamate ligase [Maricaulaceae bacterium]